MRSEGCLREYVFIHYTCLIQLSQTEILVVWDLASLKVHVHVV